MSHSDFAHQRIMDVPKVVFFDDCTAVKVDITAVIRILNPQGLPRILSTASCVEISVLLKCTIAIGDEEVEIILNYEEKSKK